MAYELQIGNCTYTFDDFTEYNVSVHNIKGLTDSEKIEFLDAHFVGSYCTKTEDGVIDTSELTDDTNSDENASISADNQYSSYVENLETGGKFKNQKEEFETALENMQSELDKIELPGENSSLEDIKSVLTQLDDLEEAGNYLSEVIDTTSRTFAGFIKDLFPGGSKSDKSALQNEISAFQSDISETKDTAISNAETISADIISEMEENSAINKLIDGSSNYLNASSIDNIEEAHDWGKHLTNVIGDITDYIVQLDEIEEFAQEYNLNVDTGINEKLKALLNSDGNVQLALNSYTENVDLVVSELENKSPEELDGSEISWFNNFIVEDLHSALMKSGLSEEIMEDVGTRVYELMKAAHEYKKNTEEEESTVSDDKTMDGEIGNSKQGSDTGDCWLLSSINSLSYTEAGQEIIEETLEYQEGGTLVHLKGAGDYFISDEEVEEARGKSSGDTDVLILELAIEKARQDVADGKIEVPSIINKSVSYADDDDILSGGTELEALYYLTGETGTCHKICDSGKYSTIDVLDKFMENSENYVLCAEAEENTTVEDIYGNEVELIGPHAYSIKAADEDTVTIVNPWDSSKNIILSRETFLEAFYSVTSLELSQSELAAES